MKLNCIERVQSRLKSVIHTPPKFAPDFSAMSGTELYFKCKHLQKKGSYR